MGVEDKRQRAERGWRNLAVMAIPLTILAGLAAMDSLLPFARASQQAPPHTRAPLIAFEANSVPNSPVKYSARAAFYSLFISNEEADIVLHGEQMPSSKLSRGKLLIVRAYASLVRMRFVGSNLPTTIAPLDSKNQPRSPYTAVVYQGIYPGTDVLLRAHEHRIGFELNLTSGANAQNIVLELAGATGIKLDSVGNAIVNVDQAAFTLQKPLIRINADGDAQLASGTYRIERGNRLRFIVPDTSPATRQTVGD